MISYRPFYETLKRKDLSQYVLIAMGISSRTLNHIKHNQGMNTVTLNKLCLLLDCTPNEIVEIIKTDEEIESLKSRFILPYRADLHKNVLKSQIRMERFGRKTEP